MGKVTTMSERLGPQPGERIDREQPVDFTFEGRRYRGYRGDTLSTALWASGVRVLGRSFKYHRPRGIFSLSGLDCNALAENRDSTNLRMDTTLIEPGLEARAVNTWGGVRSDLYRVTELFSPFLPVGFYYKVFHRPRSLFPFFESRMRRIAGLGSIHPDQPLQPTPKRYDFCDLLVVGSGPSGLSAAVAAAELGLKVLLVEEDRLPGGTLGFQLPGEPEAGGLLERLLARAAALPNLEIRTGTTAAGCYADRWVALFDSRRLTKLRARGLVVAAGCFDQPAVFRNNDLPGVMLASAAQRLIHQYAVKPFRQAVVLAANTDGYRAAVDLHRAGVRVALVSDLRPQGEASAWKEEVAGRGIPIRPGTAVFEALPAPGKRAIPRGPAPCSGRPWRGPARKVRAHCLRRHRHERGMGPRGRHPPPGGLPHGLRRIPGTVCPGPTAAGDLCRRTGQRSLCPGRPAQGRPPRRPPGRGLSGNGPSRSAGGAPTTGSRLQPPLPGASPPAGQEFRGPG